MHELLNSMSDSLSLLYYLHHKEQVPGEKTQDLDHALSLGLAPFLTGHGDF